MNCSSCISGEYCPEHPSSSQEAFNVEEMFRRLQDDSFATKYYTQTNPDPNPKYSPAAKITPFSPQPIPTNFVAAPQFVPHSLSQRKQTFPHIAFVYNISFGATYKDVLNIFRPYFPQAVDLRGGRAQGKRFAFVVLSCRSDLQNFVENVGGTILHDRHLMVREADKGTLINATSLQHPIQSQQPPISPLPQNSFWGNNHTTSSGGESNPWSDPSLLPTSPEHKSDPDGNFDSIQPEHINSLLKCLQDIHEI